MRTFIILSLLISLSAINSFAQANRFYKDTIPYLKGPAVNAFPPTKTIYNNVDRKPAYIAKLNKDTSGFAKQPLFVLKLEGQHQKYLPTVFLLGLIDQKQIISMEILKDKEAMEQFPDKGKNGVIVITVKKEAQILTLSQLFDKYNIKKRFRSLPLYIDSNFVDPLNGMIYATEKLRSVTVAKEIGTSQKYISILTDAVRFKPERGVTYIRGTATAAIEN